VNDVVSNDGTRIAYERAGSRPARQHSPETRGTYAAVSHYVAKGLSRCQLTLPDLLEDRVAHWSALGPVERDGRLEPWREATDALPWPGRGKHEALKLASNGIALAAGGHERSAPGGLERSLSTDPGEEHALGAAPLGGRPAGHEEPLGPAVLVLDPGAVAGTGEVGTVQPLGDDAPAPCLSVWVAIPPSFWIAADRADLSTRLPTNSIGSKQP
jgi:hypothetical protein